MRQHPCLVAGKRQSSPCGGVLTVHHVRSMVNPDGTTERTGKIDRRTIALCELHHLHGKGPHAIHVMTAPGRWEKFFGVEIEAAIKNYQGMWEAEQR
jgi:hypothetical protein